MIQCNEVGCCCVKACYWEGCSCRVGVDLLWLRLHSLYCWAVAALADATCCLAVASGVSLSVQVNYLLPVMPRGWRDLR